LYGKFFFDEVDLFDEFAVGHGHLLMPVVVRLFLLICQAADHQAGRFLVAIFQQDYLLNVEEVDVVGLDIGFADDGSKFFSVVGCRAFLIGLIEEGSVGRLLVEFKLFFFLPDVDSHD
jgi:hypothetical protein